MSGEIDLPLPDPGSLKRGRFTYFPVAPGRLEFAIEVRQAILRDRPQVIALELPATLEQAWMRAVTRLPQMSLIFYPDESSGDDQAIYVPVEPADPFTEAIRTGLETGAAIVFADPDAGQRPHLKDAYPDTYAVRYIGLTRYIEAYRVYPQTRSEEIQRHAAGIAWKLQGTDPLAQVLVVVSLNLLDPVLDAQPCNIDTVIVDGRILRRAGEFTALDVRQVVREATESVRALSARASTRPEC